MSDMMIWWCEEHQANRYAFGIGDKCLYDQWHRAAHKNIPAEWPCRMVERRLVSPDALVVERQEYERLRKWASLMSVLDRSPVGRHEGDRESEDPTGTSQGNPSIRTGDVIGFNMSGQAIKMPPRGQRHDPDAWLAVQVDL